MYCPDKLKLNKFCSVALPTPKALFSRFGYKIGNQSYSDSSSNPSRKIDSIKDGDRFNSMKLREESTTVVEETTTTTETES